MEGSCLYKNFYSRLAISLVFLITLIVAGCHRANVPDSGHADSPGITGEAKILKVWHGDYPAVDIDRLPEEAEHPGIGYIADDETLRNIWAAFKPGEEIPAVDFESDTMLFVRNTQYFNRISIGKVILKKGIAELVAMETLSARPIKDVVAMSMVMVPKHGITGIQARGAVIPLR